MITAEEARELTAKSRQEKAVEEFVENVIKDAIEKGNRKAEIFASKPRTAFIVNLLADKHFDVAHISDYRFPGQNKIIIEW